MPELTPFGASVPCDACGRRPAVMRVQINNPMQRGSAALCESCARELGVRRQAAADERERDGSATPALDKYGRDLTAEAAAGRIDPVIGRDGEVAQAIEILSRRRKNNVVLIGEPGVGKTAIAEGLALRIAQGDVPAALRDRRIVALDLGGMVAGSQYRG